MLGKKDKRFNDDILCAEYEAVYHYTLALCRDETIAQDITQETFLKAMKSYDKFKGDSSLYTWLCAIAKRCLINRYKKTRESFPQMIFRVPCRKLKSLWKRWSAIKIWRCTYTGFSTEWTSLIKRCFPFVYSVSCLLLIYQNFSPKLKVGQE